VRTTSIIRAMNEVQSLLECSAVYSRCSEPTFQRCVLPQSSGRFIMEEFSTSETSVNLNVTTRHYIPEDSSQNLKPHLLPHVHKSQRPVPVLSQISPVQPHVKITFGHATAQTVSRRPLTPEPRVRGRKNSCGICGGQRSNGTCSSPKSSVFPCQYHSIVTLHTHICSRG
jgi:hypothetical protein